MFNSIMMNQLMIEPKTIRQDIIDNLAASTRASSGTPLPLTNIQLFEIAKNVGNCARYHARTRPDESHWPG